MKLIRKYLFTFLGMENYLGIVSSTYLLLVKNGFLRKKYPELFFLEKVVKPGYHCIDIGANLGYYSWFISKFAGAGGRLLAVEPVPVFRKVWEKNMKSSPFLNYEMLPFALGEEERRVNMGIPIQDGVVRHGLTNVNEGNSSEESIDFEVEMKHPAGLFAKLEKLDFIKCDIEGYEHKVLPLMQQVISTFRPLVQTELGGQENRRVVVDFFSGINYLPFLLKDGKLEEAVKDQIPFEMNDFYFVPVEKIAEYQNDEVIQAFSS